MADKEYKIDKKEWLKHGSQLAIAYSPQLETTILIVGNPRTGRVTCNEFSYHTRYPLGRVIKDELKYEEEDWSKIVRIFTNELKYKAERKG